MCNVTQQDDSTRAIARGLREFCSQADSAEARGEGRRTQAGSCVRPVSSATRLTALKPVEGRRTQAGSCVHPESSAARPTALKPVEGRRTQAGSGVCPVRDTRHLGPLGPGVTSPQNNPGDASLRSLPRAPEGGGNWGQTASARQPWTLTGGLTPFLPLQWASLWGDGIRLFTKDA